MSGPLVTVVIAAWNAEETVARAVRSALAQSLKEIEVLLVDDGSSDATGPFAQLAARADPRFRLIAAPVNRGAAAARNLGLAQAKGRWIAPLDADDWMTPERLARLVAFAKLSGADIVLDDLLIAPEGASAAPAPLLGLARDAPAHPIDLAGFARANLFGAGARALGFLQPLIAGASIRRWNLRYPEGLRVGEDYMLIAEALAHGARAVLIPACGYVYVKRAGSASGRMRLCDYDALLEADAAFRTRHAARLTPQTREALDERRESYCDARAVARAGELARAGRPMDAFLALASRPGAALAAREAVLKRIGLMPRPDAR